MQYIIGASESDLLDVLAYAAFCAKPVMRTQRAEYARESSTTCLTEKQFAFVEFVLGEYISQGAAQLDEESLSALLRRMYNSYSDAFSELGPPNVVCHVFTNLQKHLYSTP